MPAVVRQGGAAQGAGLVGRETTVSDERRKLVQLPDGSWVDPGRIVGIRIIETDISETTGIDYPDSVVVELETSRRGDVYSRRFDCKSPEEALALRDRIAAMANANSPP